MSTIEEIKAKPEAERTEEEKAALAAAEAKQSDKQEHMIPKSRLDEVIAERDAARKAEAALKAAQESATAKALEEQGKWKELADTRAQEIQTLKMAAEKATSYEQVLKSTLDASLAELPEPMRKLVPTQLSVADQLGWLSQNKAILTKPAAPDLGSGRRGGGKPDPEVNLTPEIIAAAKSFGMTPEEYAKFDAGVPEKGSSFTDDKEKQ